MDHNEILREQMLSWYFSKEEIDNNSPSRKDGINARKESQLRHLYCSFIRDVGTRLKLPHLTVVTATIFCHRFYLHQSHARNEWQTVATACIFLASKVEDTPRALSDVVKAAHVAMYRRDPVAMRKIYEMEFMQKQKDLIVLAERLLLSTIRFDFNVEHPYKPLINAMNKLGIVQKDVRQFAWNLVNDWLRTTLCVQYKPHYIAAGTLFITAKLHKLALPSNRECTWWHEFDIAPKKLQDVVKEMSAILDMSRVTVVTFPCGTAIQTPSPVKQDVVKSPDSVVGCTDSLSSSEASLHIPVDDAICGDATTSSYEDTTEKHPLGTNLAAIEQQMSDRVQHDILSSSQCHNGLNEKDISRIKELLKKRKGLQGASWGTVASAEACSEDAWIEKELEAGIVLDPLHLP